MLIFRWVGSVDLLIVCSIFFVSSVRAANSNIYKAKPLWTLFVGRRRCMHRRCKNKKQPKLIVRLPCHVVANQADKYTFENTGRRSAAVRIRATGFQLETNENQFRCHALHIIQIYVVYIRYKILSTLYDKENQTAEQPANVLQKGRNSKRQKCMTKRSGR